MNGHNSGLLGIIAAQVAVIFADPTTPLAAKLAATIGTIITLVFTDRAKQKAVVTWVIAGAGLAVPLLTLLVAQLAGYHTHWASWVVNIATVLAGVFVRLPALLPSGPATAVLLLAVGLASSSARAQQPDPTPTDVAPPMSFCIGHTFNCVVWVFGAHAVDYDMIAKKWSGGVRTVAVGYALLFQSDKQWAFGPAVHAAFNFDQQAPSYFAPTFALVAFHWFEAGYTPTFWDGRIGHAVTLLVDVNAEGLVSLVTGKTIRQRLSAKRVSLGIEPLRD